MKIYNSDSEELEEKRLYSPLTFFSRKKKVPAILTTIVCSDRNIKGNTLIKRVHAFVQRWQGEAIDYACEPERDQGGTAMIPVPTVDHLTLWIQYPQEWFMTLGGWKGMIPSEEQKHYFFFKFSQKMKSKKFCSVRIFNNSLTFPLRDHRVHLPAKFSIDGFDVTQSWRKDAKNKWEKTTKTDLSYKQIVKAITHIKETYEVKDAQIAELQLCNLNNSTELPKWLSRLKYKKDVDSISTFLDYLNALMFGVEASGLNAALLTSAMTLDLIVDGVYSYTDAFTANDDGGIYPYACFGENKGTYVEREKALKLEPPSMSKFRNTPALSPVAVKEAIIIKQWLQHSSGILDAKLTYEQQMRKIDAAINDLGVFCFYPEKRHCYSVKKFKKHPNTKHIDADVAAVINRFKR